MKAKNCANLDKCSKNNKKNTNMCLKISHLG